MTPFEAYAILITLAIMFISLITGTIIYVVYVYNKRLVIIHLTGHVDIRHVKKFYARHRVKVTKRNKKQGDIVDTIIPITHDHIFPSIKPLSIVREWVFWREGDIEPISLGDPNEARKIGAWMGITVASEDDPTIDAMTKKQTSILFALALIGVGALIGAIIAAAAGHMTL